MRSFAGRTIVSMAEVNEYKKKTGVSPTLYPIDQETKQQYFEILNEVLSELQAGLQAENNELENIRASKNALEIEDLAERKRMTDLYAKFKRLLDDSDLLILPRATLIDINERLAISPEIHHLNDDQFRAIKEFVKLGKPVLFCMGPTNEPGETFDGETESIDAVESMLRELGFHLPRQTVLFNVEANAFAEKTGAAAVGGIASRGPCAQVCSRAGNLG